MGLFLSDLDSEDILIWPDNWNSFTVFEAMGTQWRTGGCGATGLDYCALPEVMRLCGIKKRHQPDMFYDVRVMEAEALKVMAERTDS
ncbi:DUF1799 domain-containing protein [Pseudomonas luteola]|uniref:DUF1799 domain-containing protein n=1 Tax=Pseudomonas luteola TaxID=47886 RepID=UPI003D9FCEA1